MTDPDAYNPADRPPARPKRDWTNVGTPVRTVRLPDELWADVTAEGQRTSSSTSAVIRNALDAYLDRRP